MGTCILSSVKYTSIRDALAKTFSDALGMTWQAEGEIKYGKIMQRVPVFQILVMALVFLTAAGAQAVGPWYVATNGADSNDGTSWAVPYLTISNALTNASSGGDTIWVSNGVYTLTATVSNPAAKKFNIRAWSTNPADTVLLGHGSNPPPDNLNFRGVWMSGAGSLLQGFTVTNFYHTNDYTGAGIYCSAGLVSNCIIAGNIMGYTGSSGSGGGVYLSDNAVVENCTIVGNVICPAGSSAGGGGVYIKGDDASGGRIRNCRIVGNWMSRDVNGYGGGVYMSGLSSIIQDSIIASNDSYWVGGIHMYGGIVTNCQVFANNSYFVGGIYSPFYEKDFSIMQCVVSNNYGRNSAGGVYLNYVTNALISGCAIVSNRTMWGTPGGLCVLKNARNVLIRNCVVANNLGENSQPGTTYGFGGAGMQVLATNALIENCTIVSNTLIKAGYYGAGLYATNGVAVVNCIIYHNSAVDASSNFYAAADCTFSNSCAAPLPGTVAWTGTGTANTDANPQFVAKDTGNFRLTARSPCVNTGTNQNWMMNAVDLEGRKRMRYGRVDMGVYERIYEGSIYTVK